MGERGGGRKGGDGGANFLLRRPPRPRSRARSPTSPLPAAHSRTRRTACLMPKKPCKPLQNRFSPPPLQAYDQHLNMILGDVEETATVVEVDDETYEEIVKVRRKRGSCLRRVDPTGRKHKTNRPSSLFFPFLRPTSGPCRFCLCAATASSWWRRRCVSEEGNEEGRSDRC